MNATTSRTLLNLLEEIWSYTAYWNETVGVSLAATSISK
jgi:hypothetical protein